MSTTDTNAEATARKGAIRVVMRRLSETHADEQAAARLRFKEQAAQRRSVLSKLGQTPATVPELSAATGIPSAEVLIIIATLRRYGVVVEDEQQESYFRYRLVPPTKEA